MSEAETSMLFGKAVRIVFRNDSTMYTVLRFQLNDESERVITVTGLFPAIEKDVLYRIYGRYVEHPRYGMQFAMRRYEKPLPNEREGIIRYLSGIRFPGIGKKTAEKIVDLIGEDCLETIKADPDVLRNVRELSPEKRKTILDGINEDDEGMSQLVQFLNVHGIGMRNLIRLNRAYGKEALEKLKENPYRVIDECDGFGFATADKIAESLGFAKDDERRLYAYLVSLCMDRCMAGGDSWVGYDDLKETFLKKTRGADFEYDDLFQKAVINRRLIMEENRVYPVTQYEAETGIAGFLRYFPYAWIDPYDPDELVHDIEVIEKEFGISYDESQKEAITSFFTSPFMILTGGPGTGKTTVVRAMVRLFRLMYPDASLVCAAPTGRAAKRLSELTGNEATTIHSLLKWDLETNTFGVNEEEPLDIDVLIVDEFSMVDAWVFHNLLKASRSVKKICIIGDEDQLPSVSPGSVLRDLIESQRFPLIRLNHIYRQKDGSDVIALAHSIREGNADLAGLKGDVRFLECERYQIRDAVLTIVRNALDKGYDINDIQVLSPMYGGAAGIDILNNALQETFNPPAKDRREFRYGYLTFRTGDKILQLKNQPDDDVYNGDIGILEEILKPEETENHQTVLVVRFDDIYVEYNQENLGNITLAYCISVHKSQGSEYPIVIFPITFQHVIMLQRNLIYTGVTRARQSLVMIGEADAFRKGIETKERHHRQTGLKERLSIEEDILL